MSVGSVEMGGESGTEAGGERSLASHVRGGQLLSCRSLLNAFRDVGSDCWLFVAFRSLALPCCRVRMELGELLVEFFLGLAGDLL